MDTLSSILKGEAFNTFLKIMSFKLKENKLVLRLMAFWIFLIIISINLGKNNPLFLLSNENSIIQYIFSAIAQTMAALFGLTITGYIFFITNLKQEAREPGNNYKNYSIDRLLNTNYYPVIFLSLVCTLSISLSLLALIIEDFYISIFVYNLASASTITGLLSIFTFIMKILNPSYIKIQSKKIIEETLYDLVNKHIILFIGNNWEELDKHAVKQESSFNKNPSPSISVTSARDLFALINVKLQIYGEDFLNEVGNNYQLLYKGYIHQMKDYSKLANGLESLAYYDRIADFAKFYLIGDVITYYSGSQKKKSIFQDDIESFKNNILSTLKTIIKCLGLLVTIDPNANVYEYNKTLFNIANSYNSFLTTADPRKVNQENINT